MTDPLPAEQRRASDADREHVAQRLRDAAGDGRLTIPELEVESGSRRRELES